MDFVKALNGGQPEETPNWTIRAQLLNWAET